MVVSRSIIKNRSRHRQKTGKHMRKLIALALIASLAGCATIDGVGRDISGAARGVQSWF
jgi:predicted small secreted protein